MTDEIRPVLTLTVPEAGKRYFGLSLLINNLPSSWGKKIPGGFAGVILGKKGLHMICIQLAAARRTSFVNRRRADATPPASFRRSNDGASQ